MRAADAAVFDGAYAAAVVAFVWHRFTDEDGGHLATRLRHRDVTGYSGWRR